MKQITPKPSGYFSVTGSARKAYGFARNSFIVTLTALLIWLSAVFVCMASILRVTNSPGSAGAIPQRWPVQSQIILDGNRPTLVLFVHPHCPCTRATIGELELLMARCRDRISAHVIFIRPAGTAEDWTQTDLWRTASAIPEVTVQADTAEVETKFFNAETSGQTMLYDPYGDLLFQGGITISRGHSGDNPGRDALVALVEHSNSIPIKTPVFGCPLYEAAIQRDVSLRKP